MAVPRARKNGSVYESPITVTTTSVVRAMAFQEGYAPSRVETHSYIFAKDVIHQPQAPEGWPKARGTGGSKGFFGFGRRAGRQQPIDYAMADPDSMNATEEEVIEALTAISTLSIVTDQSHLFDPKTGIYSRPDGRGREWERAISLELLDPNGDEEGFQTNGGIRIRGGHSRSLYCQKHSYRVYFRNEYGDGPLKYPMFDKEGTDEFNDFDLRTAPELFLSLQ